jgi:hypothetical protein
MKSNILITMQLGSGQYMPDVAVRIRVDILQTVNISMVRAALNAHLFILNWIAC